jgi:hypothetical protein
MLAVFVALGVAIGSVFAGSTPADKQVTFTTIKITSSKTGKVTEAKGPFTSPAIVKK